MSLIKFFDACSHNEILNETYSVRALTISG